MCMDPLELYVFEDITPSCDTIFTQVLKVNK